MTRTRTRHQLVTNPTRQNTTYRNRLNGFLKKAEELSILCGVDIGIVIHKQGENNAVQWPNPEIFRERLLHFLSFPERERANKTVSHEKFLERRLDTERKNLLKLKEKNEEKEFNQLMHEIMQGKDLNELDLNQLTGLHTFAADLLDKLQKLDEEEDKEQQPLMDVAPQGTVPGSDGAPTFVHNNDVATDTLLENLPDVPLFGSGRQDVGFFSFLPDGFAYTGHGDVAGPSGTSYPHNVAGPSGTSYPNDVAGPSGTSHDPNN